MTSQQEQRIFGNALPDSMVKKVDCAWVYENIFQCKIELPSGRVPRKISAPAYYALQTERQRREAIGMWIGAIMDHYKIGYTDNAVSRHLDIRHLFDKEIQWLESTLGRPWQQIKAEWKGE